MPDMHLVLSLTRVATAALASTIGILGLRAYLRTHQHSLLALASGAGLLAAGYFAEGLLVEFGGWSVSDATVLESATTLLAITLLVASLYLKDARHAATREAGGSDAHVRGSPR
jgi:hypothetical protein